MKIDKRANPISGNTGDGKRQLVRLEIRHPSPCSKPLDSVDLKISWDYFDSDV